MVLHQVSISDVEQVVERKKIRSRVGAFFSYHTGWLITPLLSKIPSSEKTPSVNELLIRTKRNAGQRRLAHTLNSLDRLSLPPCLEALVLRIERKRLNRIPEKLTNIFQAHL